MLFSKALLLLKSFDTNNAEKQSIPATKGMEGFWTRVESFKLLFTVMYLGESEKCFLNNSFKKYCPFF